jgi:hypothetical protein
MTTEELYQITRTLLKQEKNPALIGRYHLKKAIFALGPSSFPFTNFVAQMFEKQHYKVEVAKVLNGACCRQEADILAIQDSNSILVECKFNHQAGLKSDLNVSLYTKARFDDIVESYKIKKQIPPHYAYWIVTNTRFTDTATQYGECQKMFMMSWSYPNKNGLKDVIDSLGLHPITCLSSLSKPNIELLLGAGIVLCLDVQNHITLLKRIQLSDKEINAVLEESKSIYRGMPPIQ